MRKHRTISPIGLQNSRMLTYWDLAKFNLPYEIFISLPLLSSDILRYNFNLYFSNLINNFLHIKIEETIERRNLLRDKAMLRKIASNDCPCVLLINVISRHTIFFLLEFRFRHIVLERGILLNDMRVFLYYHSGVDLHFLRVLYKLIKINLFNSKFKIWDFINQK